MGEQKTTASSVNRAKTYQLVLFPLNNGATNVYYVLVLSYIATFGSKVLALSMLFASVMVTGMRLFDAVTDPSLVPSWTAPTAVGKFRPFMVIGNLIMAASILVLYCLTPLIPASAMGLRYAAFVALYAVWVIGYTFQTSCTRSGQTVLTNDPKQRPLFTIFNTVGSLLGMGAMQFFAPILAKNYEAATLPPGSSARWLQWHRHLHPAHPAGCHRHLGEGPAQVLWHRRRKDREDQSERIPPDHQEQRPHAAADGGRCRLQAGTFHRHQHHRAVHAVRLHDGQLRRPVPAMMVLGYVCSVPFFLLHRPAPARRKARRPA